MNPGPLAPKARIIPLDQQAFLNSIKFNLGRLEMGPRPSTIPYTEVFQLAVTEILVLNARSLTFVDSFLVLLKCLYLLTIATL